MSTKQKPVTLCVLVVFAVSLIAVIPASAQGGGMPPLPSAAGGIPGSPGMGGAATLSMPPVDVPQPTVPQVSPPSFTPPSVQPPAFDPSAFTGNIPSFTPPTGEGFTRPGGGERPGAGQRPGGQAGESAPNLAAWGSSFSPFSQNQDGQWSRFGERGSGNLPLETFQPEGALGWFDAGGFGAPAELPDDIDPADLQAMASEWKPDGVPDELPAAPAAFDDITGLAEAQQQAQDALGMAGENRDDIAADVQSTIQTTSQQAQQTYDQFWQDYYDAVDYTAQAYYDVVTATADVLLQTYTVALEYTFVAVDYYLAYYDQYATYCYYYPWDCAMYAYDLASGVYYYTGDVSDEPVAYVAIGDVNATTAYPPADSTPAPSAEAYKAVTVFANDQLGAVVEPLYAGEATDDVQAALQAMPEDMQAFVLNTLAVSCADYWALLSGGVAGVLAGDCGAGPHDVTLQTMNAELSSASVGAYAIYAQAAAPATPADALDLITHVYPALEGLAFAQITDIEQGMAFTATTAGLATDPATGESLSAPKVIYAGVVTVDGQTLVYALVGVGESYVDLIAAGE